MLIKTQDDIEEATGSSELVASVPLLAMPARVVSENTEQLMLGQAKDAMALKVVSAEDFKKAAELQNALGRSRTYLKKQRLALDKPLRDEVDRRQAWIDEEIKKLSAPTEEAERTLSAELLAYDRLQKAEAAKAEAARQAAAQAARAAAETARRAEEEKARLAREAELRKAQAEEKLETATDEEAFSAAGDAFHKGLAVEAEAQAAPVPEIPQALIEAPKEIVVPQVLRATGTKLKRTPVIEATDVTKLPSTYLIPDEAKIKRHILDGTITDATPGIKFRIDESFTSTGR